MSPTTATRTTPAIRPNLLPPKRPHLYAPTVATSSDGGDIRRFRADDELWDAYAQVVGERNRSADIRDYIEWRIENPDTPLPGRWRGPRGRRATKPQTSG